MSSDSREIADRVWLVLDTVAVSNPSMPLGEAVKLIQDTYAKVEWFRENGHSTPPPVDSGPLPSRSALSSPEALGARLKDQRTVTEAIIDGNRIVAIKEARRLTGVSLKEAKEAVEWLWDNWTLYSPKPPPGARGFTR